MIGLLSPPAVIRLFGRESTPVKSATAVGHRADRASRATCCDARADSLTTEICGLFLSASCSASLMERALGPIVLAGAADDCGPAVLAGTPEPAPTCDVGACG